MKTVNILDKIENSHLKVPKTTTMMSEMNQKLESNLEVQWTVKSTRRKLPLTLSVYVDERWNTA